MASLTYGGVLGAGKGYTVVDTPNGPATIVGDRATRNNNPGNIEAGPYANSYGAIGDDGRFAVFGSRLTGTRAQAGLIFGSRYANLTLREAIAKYAPSFENNSAAYAAAVAAAAGVSLNTKMKDIPAEKRAAVVAGMQAVEGNTSAKVYDAQGNLIGTIDPTSPRTPNTAPTPYSPDSQMADMSPGAPIGHVSRSPLGPAIGAPSFSGMATPRGIGSIASAPALSHSPVAAASSRPSVSSFSGQATPRGAGTPSQAMSAPSAVSSMRNAAPQAAPSSAPSGSFVSQDEKTNTGTIANAPNAGNFVSQDERQSLAERMGIAPDPSTLGPVAPAISAPSIAPTKPTIAPAAVAPAVAAVAPARVAVTAAPSRPSMAPAQPSLSAADVYGGAIGTAQTSTPGTTVSRATSFGPTYTTNKFGAVTATDPNGTQMAVWGGVPSPAISGPLSQPGIATQAPSTGMFGPRAKSATGTIAGAALGGYTLGPLGAILGGIVGKNLAQGKAPLSGLFGGANSTVGTHVVDTFDGPMRAANAVGGLGFPGKPSGPAPGGVASGMRGLSPGAANAIDHGYAGLY